MARMLLIAVGMLSSLALAAPQDPLVDFCGSDEKKQTRAYRTLLRQGTPRLPAIQDRLKNCKDDALRQRLQKLVTAIKKSEPHGLQIRIGVPKLRFDAARIASTKPGLLITIRNKSAKPVTLWPYASLRLLDAQGQVVKPRRQGRWGLRVKRCYLLDVEYVTLAPGELWRKPFSLARYLLDLDSLLSWKDVPPGRYTLEVRYHFDRAKAKKRVRIPLPDIDAAKHPWNHALEIDHVVTAELTVAA